MAGEKRFGTSLFGFAKTDVNTYIERMLKEFDEKLKEKDDELNAWKNQFRDAKAKYEELTRKADQVNEDRAKIADVLIKAQDKAEQLLEDARTQALEEKKKLEHSIEQEKEKLVDIKEDLKTLKSIVVDTLEKYESQLNEMIDEGETEEEAS
jgi:chromosome segregation ATPase